jgi:hypothetical protein
MTEAITDVPDHMFKSVYWRKNNVTHFQEEIFIDIIEEMYCTVERYRNNLKLLFFLISLTCRNGAVLRSGVNGSIKVRSELSGIVWNGLLININDNINRNARFDFALSSPRNLRGCKSPSLCEV